MTSFRAQYKEAKKEDPLFAQVIKARTKYTLDSLEEQQIALTRQTYFEEADRLRAQDGAQNI